MVQSLQLMVLGPSGVGKRNIVQQYLKTRTQAPDYGKPFSPEESYICEYPGENLQLTLTIIDTCRDKLSSTLMRKMVAACDGFILVYSAADKGSFEFLSSVRNVILEEKYSLDDVPLFVVGHREDCGQRVWTSEKAEFVTWEWQNAYREILGNNAKHINSLFENLIKKCLDVSRNTLHRQVVGKIKSRSTGSTTPKVIWPCVSKLSCPGM